MVEREYRACSRCLMDTNDDVEIVFDEKGICNHCDLYDVVMLRDVPHAVIAEKYVADLVAKIKQSGKGRHYDCLIGISGGVDSTYVALKAKELGLRPLLLHFDNGWNSDLAVKNIERTAIKLNLDLESWVVDWEEFRDIQKSYLHASVVDIENPTDNGIFGALYYTAKKEGIKYILAGTNTKNEGFLPSHWAYHKYDSINIKAIHSKYGQKKMETFPLFGLHQKWFYEKALGINWVSLLNFVDYNKIAAETELKEKLDWVDYGGKHHESIFTRFYQGYILPNKFGIDKRKAHYSMLIRSGQMQREEGVELMKQPVYALEMIEKDRDFVIKKFEMTEDEFESIMKAKPQQHRDYPSIFDYYDRLKPLVKVLKKTKLI